MNELLNILNQPGGYEIAWDYCLEYNIFIPGVDAVANFSIRSIERSRVSISNGHDSFSDYRQYARSARHDVSFSNGKLWSTSSVAWASLI